MVLKKYNRVLGENYIRAIYKNNDGYTCERWFEYTTDSDNVIYLLNKSSYDSEQLELLDTLNNVMPMHEQAIKEVANQFTN